MPTEAARVIPPRRLLPFSEPRRWQEAERALAVCRRGERIAVTLQEAIAKRASKKRQAPGCRGYTTWISGRAGCGGCGWGMSARVADVGTPGSARFAQAALSRVGQSIALAVGEVAQALFEAVLP